MNEENPISDLDLHAYLDGELPPERRRAVEAYLVANPGEAERLASWVADADAIRKAYEPVETEPVPERLLRAAAPRKRPLIPYLAGAAAVLAAFVAGFGAGRLPVAVDEDVLARAGLQAHMLYTPEKIHPIEVAASDQPHLENWLSKRVGLPVAAPDLSASGLTLLGGRVAPVNGAAGALFMYENAGGERFTLLVARGERPDRPLSYHEEGNYGAYDWGSSGYGYVLAGPHDGTRLDMLRETLVRSL